MTDAPKHDAGPKLTKAQREAWLLERIQKEPGGMVDICNQDFVDDYIGAAGAIFRPRMWGAHKCAQLGRDLSRMATRRGPSLKRSRTSLGDMGTGLGFPRWVYSYCVHPHWSDAGRDAIAKADDQP